VTPANPEPVQPGERAQVIDVLRGIAIFGILLVNMMLFAHPVYQEVIEVAPLTNPLDRAATWLIAFFAEGKFFTLFSLLFGLGLALQMHRAQAKGVQVVPLYIRRLLVLLVIGLAHAFLLWWGDILIYYALLGLVLILFRDSTPRTLLKWAVAFFILPLVINAGLIGSFELARGTPEGAASIQAALAEAEAHYRAAYEQALMVYRGADFTAMIPQRLEDWVFGVTGVLLSGMFSIILAMLLVGLYIGKLQWLHRPQEHLPVFRRVFAWGAGVGIAANLLYVTLIQPGRTLEPSWEMLLGLAAFVIGAPALSLAYTAGLVLLFQQPRWKARLAPLAAVGRTALSNYLLQTIVCTTIFYGYGLGLFGQIGPAAGVGLTLAIFGLQIVLSNAWVKRFSFGPFEWLWRSLTYGRLQPMRIESPTRVVLR